MTPPTPKRQRLFIILLSAIVTVLLVFAILQQVLDLSPYFSAPPENTTLLLWALTSLNVILLVICTLILLRNLLKLYWERKSHQLGSKFRTKLVIAFIGLSIIPVFFMALFAYTLVHRNLDKWFSTPIDRVIANVGQIVEQINQDASIHAVRSAKFLAAHPAVRRVAENSMDETGLSVIKTLTAEYEIPLLILFGPSRRPVLICQGNELYKPGLPAFRRIADPLRLIDGGSPVGQIREEAFNRLINNAGKNEMTLTATDQGGQQIILAGAAIHMGGFEAPSSLVIGYKIRGNLLELASQIAQSRQDYYSRSKNRPVVRDNFMLWLGLITMLILFAAVWIGLYLSKKIAIPIRALAEASNEVSKGNLLVHIECPAEDELGILVDSFNQMTTQLHESSQKLGQTNLDLQASNRELEERRRYTEAVLENIPTGVVSLTPGLHISRVNRAALKMLTCDSGVLNQPIKTLFQGSDLREIESLIDKAARAGIASRDFRLHPKGRQLYCAVTVSALLRSGDASSEGFVMVVEDLTELLKAQRANAWRDVARRMAHEIKNPLTPIQLSAERLLKNYGRAKTEGEDGGQAEFEPVLRECVQTIKQEVSSLKAMVDEFSRFARMPAASRVSTNLNTLIEKILAGYNGRFEGVDLDTSLSELPEVLLDPEQFKRAFVNLIDNALEAMEEAPKKKLSIASQFYANRETVEIVIKDTGHGIPSTDKEKLFLPYFSTKKRGTGLGLAIVSRIVADHKGYIHVEDNIPAGASFVIEIPAR